MSTNISSQLSQLLVQTHASLENARNGNWERVVKDEKARRGLIADLFSEPMDASTAAKYGSTIEQILQLNKQLEQITANARNTALSGAGSITKGRRALNMYAKNGG